MDTYAIMKFVSSLFNIRCVAHEQKTQFTSELHHQTFKNILSDNNINKLIIDKIEFRKIMKSEIRNINDTDGIYYVEEPYGTQNPPDFLLCIIHNKKIQKTLSFELKTGRKKIMWNDGHPRKNTIYLYTDNKLCKSLVLLGDNLINDDTRKILDKYLNLIKKMNIEIKSDMSNCSDNFNIYVRKANSQTIDISKYSLLDIINFKKNICLKINKFINIPKLRDSVNSVQNMPKKGISLFSGAGGDTIGMTNAGVDVVGFVEFDEDAIQTHLLNFPNSELIGKDICDIKDEKFQEYKDTGIDIVFGGFPCFIAGTKILTNNGYINIEDIKATNKLLTHTGEFQNIVNKQIKQYTGDLYSIKAKYHPNPIKCTPEHPFYCREQLKTWNVKTNKYDYTYSAPKWINADKLSKNHYLGMVINNKSIIPSFTIEKVDDDYKTFTETITLKEKYQWYIMGCFIGNGWIEEIQKPYGIIVNEIRFGINNNAEKEASDLMKKILHITNKTCDTGLNKKIGWVDILKQLGKHVHDRLIPEWVHDAPIELIQEFINGYKKTTSYYNNKYYSTTVSENLAFGIQRLYLKLGHIVSIIKSERPNTCVIDGKNINQHETYRIQVHPTKKEIVSSFIEDCYVWYNPILIERTPINNTTVYNFEVDNDNSYCVENLIVHNCQSFSHGGKKNSNDPRGHLYKEFVRAARIIRPKYILGENVKGILSRKNTSGGLIINDIISDFNEIGYSMIYKLIKCEKFGIPQKRQRVFFIGVNDEFLQQHALDINDILVNLPDTNNQTNTLRNICEFSLVNAIKIEKQKFLDIIPDNKVIDAVNGSADDSAVISGNIPTNLLKCYDERANHGLSFDTRSKSTFGGIENLDGQAHTILCAYNRMPRLFIPLKNSNGVYLRSFNIKELQQIQGFPVDYQFSGSENSIIKQIGNAVPPNVVTHIVTYLLGLIN